MPRFRWLRFRRAKSEDVPDKRIYGHLYGTPRPEELPEEMVGSTAKGPLPFNWEIGYSETGEKYFIDHNSGTTTWDDPRLLPDGWEEVDDPVYGVFYVDHVNKRTQYERPGPPHPQTQPYQPVIPRYENTNGFSGFNGNQTNGTLPHTSQNYHAYQPVPQPSSKHDLVFTRDVNQLRGEMINTTILKGPKGLGFTLIGNDASSKGDEFIQVKSVLAGGPAAENGVLQAGDVLVRVNGEMLLGASQSEACRVFVGIPIGDPVNIQVCRGYPLMLDPSNRIITENVYATGGRRDQRDEVLQDIEIFKGNEGFGFTIADSITGQRIRKILHPAQCPNLMEGDTIVELDGHNVKHTPHTQLVDMLRECPVGHRGRLVVRRASPKHRSRTPTAAFRYGEQRTTPLPVAATAPRSKTPSAQQRIPSSEFYGNGTLGRPSTLQRQPNIDDFAGSKMRPSSTTLGFATPNYIPISALQKDRTNDLIVVNLIRKPNGFGFRLLGGQETQTLLTVGQIVSGGAAADDGRLAEGDEIVEIDGQNVEGASHGEAVTKLESAARNKHVKMVVRRPKQEMSHSLSMPAVEQKRASHHRGEYDVVLRRGDRDGFGFVIISALDRNGSTIGQIMENSPASQCGQLRVGDRVTAVNGMDIHNMSHGEIVNLIKASGLTVRLTIAPPGFSEPVASSTLTRNGKPNGFGVTSVQESNYTQYSQIGVPPSRTSMYSTVPGDTISRGMNGMKFDPVAPEQNWSLLNVELERGARGFGFSIRGGQEFDSMPLFVLRIAEDGPAALDGRLKVGDQLITINGNDTQGLTHENAINLIKQHPTVRLTVRRHRMPSS